MSSWSHFIYKDFTFSVEKSSTAISPSNPIASTTFIANSLALFSVFSSISAGAIRDETRFATGSKTDSTTGYEVISP